MRYASIVHDNRESDPERSTTNPRDLLRVLLTAHCELTEVAADQLQQLRAMLLRGDNRDRRLGRSGLCQGALFALTDRKPPQDATDGQLARHDEIQRIAQVVIAYRDELSANREQMVVVVNELAPGMTAQPGMGPFRAAKAILDGLIW
jgi:hypothetical protein